MAKSNAKTVSLAKHDASSAKDQVDVQMAELNMIMAAASSSSERNQRALKKNDTTPLDQLSTREYLNRTVIPPLMKALSELSKARPQDPLTFLGEYLMKINEENIAKAAASQ